MHTFPAISASFAFDFLHTIVSSLTKQLNLAHPCDAFALLLSPSLERCLYVFIASNIDVVIIVEVLQLYLTATTIAQADVRATL